MNAAKQKPRETVEVVEAGNAPVVAQRRGILIPEGRTSFLAQVFAQSKAAERVQDAGYNLQVSMLSQVTGTLEKTTPINFRDLLGWRRELLHYNAPPYEEKTAISADEESIFSGAVLREPVTVTQQLRYATGSYQASSSLIEKV